MEDADIANLPSIVRETQLQAPLEVPPIPEMGFFGGRFYGPNFTADHAGVEFHGHFDPSAPRPDDLRDSVPACSTCRRPGP